jgi:hypothetical protein
MGRIRLTDAQYRFLFRDKKTSPARNLFKRRTADQPENQVEAQVLGWLRIRGWICTRQQSGLFSRPFAPQSRITVGERGMADYRCERPIIPAGKRPQDGTWPHELWYLETKGLGERPSPAQQAWLDARNALGTPATWCDSLGMLQDWYRARYGDRAGDPPAAAK